MKSSDKLYVYLAIIISMVFLLIVFIDNKTEDKRLNQMQLIEKQDSVNVYVKKSYLERGGFSFNEKYYIFWNQFKENYDIENILYINTPYKLYKKENNDTLWILNKDITLIFVYK